MNPLPSTWENGKQSTIIIWIMAKSIHSVVDCCTRSSNKVTVGGVFVLTFINSDHRIGCFSDVWLRMPDVPPKMQQLSKIKKWINKACRSLLILLHCKCCRRHFYVYIGDDYCRSFETTCKYDDMLDL